jgi:hypothetical protein
MIGALGRPTILLGAAAVGFLALKAVLVAAIYRRLDQVERHTRN